MLFQLNITLTEEDYLDFNHFHALESISAKKQLNKTRMIFVTAFMVLAALVVLILGWTTFSVTYLVLLGICAVLYMAFFKKLIKRNIKSQIKMLKKTGKLPFDAASVLEFYEDKLVEITEAKRVEQSYGVIERICVVEDRYIFLYNSSVGAYILPIPQIKTQLSQDAFLRFLSAKCPTVEHY